MLLKRTLRAIGWLIVGVAVGMSNTQLAATAPKPSSQGTRLTLVRTGFKSGDAELVFVRDSKSGGCWIARVRSDGYFLGVEAQAPAAACN